MILQVLDYFPLLRVNSFYFVVSHLTWSKSTRRGFLLWAKLSPVRAGSVINYK